MYLVLLFKSIQFSLFFEKLPRNSSHNNQREIIYFLCSANYNRYSRVTDRQMPAQLFPSFKELGSDCECELDYSYN